MYGERTGGTMSFRYLCTRYPNVITVSHARLAGRLDMMMLMLASDVVACESLEHNTAGLHRERRPQS